MVGLPDLAGNGYLDGSPCGDIPAFQRFDTRPGMRGSAGGVLSAFAVGCPICNKLVVALVGVSGALNVWAPVQPLVGMAALALLGYALHTGSPASGRALCPFRRPARLGSSDGDSGTGILGGRTGQARR